MRWKYSKDKRQSPCSRLHRCFCYCYLLRFAANCSKVEPKKKTICPDGVAQLDSLCEWNNFVLSLGMASWGRVWTEFAFTMCFSVAYYPLSLSTTSFCPFHSNSIRHEKLFHNSFRLYFNRISETRFLRTTTDNELIRSALFTLNLNRFGFGICSSGAFTLYFCADGAIVKFFCVAFYVLRELFLVFFLYIVEFNCFSLRLYLHLVTSLLFCVRTRVCLLKGVRFGTYVLKTFARNATWRENRKFCGAETKMKWKP